MCVCAATAALDWTQAPRGEDLTFELRIAKMHHNLMS